MGENICKLYDKDLIFKIYKNSYNSTSKKEKKNLVKNGQRIWIDIFPKMTYRWPVDEGKDTQHH